MDTAAYATEEEPTRLDVKRAPFAQVLVTLTKQAYTQLIWDARYWKRSHQRAIARAQQLEAQHRLALEQAALREASLRSDLEAAQAKIRDLSKRVFGRKSEHSSDVGKAAGLKSSRLRGQQPGAPGHGRAMQAHLPAPIKTIGSASAQCPS